MRNLIISISTFHLAFLVFSEASSQDLPDLSRLDYEVRTSIESACGYKKRMEGPDLKKTPKKRIAKAPNNPIIKQTIAYIKEVRDIDRWIA